MMFKRQFLLSVVLHIIHGFLFEKSKLYYPYMFGRNILLMRTDLFKFYISASFVFLGLPYVLSKMSPNRYSTIYSTVENRYQTRNEISLQIGSCLSGISMALTGFCSSYLPIYLAISPILFLYSVAASYTAYIVYHVFGGLFFNRVYFGPIRYDLNRSSSMSEEKSAQINIGRVIILSLAIILLLLFETSEQSVAVGHTPEDLLDLISHGDYLPPGLGGLLCGFVNYLIIFTCNEYQTLTSEWLMNIFYYTSEFSLEKTHVNGHVCLEQIFKIFAIGFGARLSLWTSKRSEIPHIDWLFYALIGCGSFFGSFAICLTTATFSDHVYLITGLIENLPGHIISMTLSAAWLLLYSTKLLGISNLR